ncbi:MAG: RNA-binding protein [Chlamydiae bacterium SM23_39]|nr:MAG: RNA-binding protein [Chlamydiae bacterium SM23_39]
MEIYIGNLPNNYSEEELKETFSQFGELKSAKIILDPITHESKGYGFVEMKNAEEGQRAIDQLDGQTIYGKTIFVSKAHLY